LRGLTLSEVRNAARSLARSPTVTSCAILCLALGVGATTAISSALSRALFQPLPFREPERLVAVHRTTPQSGPTGGWSQSAPNYIDIRDQSTQVQGLAAITWGTAIINLPGEAIQATQHYVTGNMFNTLGVRAQSGRMLQPDDDRDGAELVAVLGDDIWRARFGADPAIVGRPLIIDGAATTIVGIAPPGFRIPHAGNMLRAEVWMPIRFTTAQLAARRSNNLLTLGRLAPGATVASASAELRGIFRNLVVQFPQLRGDNLRVAPLHAESLSSVRKPLILLFGAVCMVLLIAATNVAALLLARGVQRRREMAVRTALGATRWDTVRPVLLESFIISTASVVLGIALAAAAVKTIGLLAAARLPQLEGLRLDANVLVFALVISVVVAILCGAAPGWRSASVDPQDALRGGRGGGAGRQQHRALRSLVVAEISLSLVLLIGAGLMLKAFARLLANDPGFDASRVLTLRITTSALRYPNQTAVRDFLEPSIAAIRGVPGVEAAGAISAVPYLTWGNNSNIRYEGMPKEDPASLPIVEQRRITPGFFDVTKQRLIAGRLLTTSDDERPEAPAVTVVNGALVKRDFPDRDPIGQRFHTTDTTFATIVGVVSDIRNSGPVADPAPEMYRPYRQTVPGASTVSLMVRVSGGEPASVMPGIRTAVRGIDPTAAIASVQSMDDVISGSLGRPRFYFTLLGTFAAMAILLAVAGLYGVLSYAVAQRTREIGIRAALGSSRQGLVRLIAAEGFRLVVAGVVIGLLGGLAVTRLMEFMLYGVSPLDAATWAMAAGVLILAAMAAAFIPARRASRVDPLIAIQAE
jgi:putative ABC transport system permease protein